MNKRKIVNDPVHGFIHIPTDLLFDLIEHPFMQRMRRIQQLGMTSLVYPGATHTRFQHVLGSMHLMSAAVEVLRQKGHCITAAESEAVHAAILMHDLGHGPFSHVLEHSIVKQVNHESLSLLFMNALNQNFDGALSMAIAIFTDRYPKRYLHQLVSSQLDMDRLDYLLRDSFFTGVSEGVVSSDRIIKMLDVYSDRLVVEKKGIYSIEKFLIARRLMYWQVYLHKTALVGEKMLIEILKRARTLFSSGALALDSTPLGYFVSRQVSVSAFSSQPDLLVKFSHLDDSDVLCALKSWQQHSDKVLSELCRRLLSRQLLAVELRSEPISEEEIEKLKHLTAERMGLSELKDADSFVYTGVISNKTYDILDDKIEIYLGGDAVREISQVSDMLDPEVWGRNIEKWYLCYPKAVT